MVSGGYLEPSGISAMKFFATAKIRNYFRKKNAILDVSLGSKYVFGCNIIEWCNDNAVLCFCLTFSSTNNVIHQDDVNKS